MALSIGDICIVLVINASTVALSFYLGAYFKKKGENLATREDIAKITEQVEGVKHQYVLLTEDLKTRNQLRVASLDKRLQAHQEAFALWREMLSGKDMDQEGKSRVLKCQAWYDNNCLYLEPDAREAFLNAYASLHMLSALNGNVGPDGTTHRTDAWKGIVKAGDVIVKAVQLPGLSKGEADELIPEDLKKAA